MWTLFFLLPLAAQSAWDAHTVQGNLFEKQGRYAAAAAEFRAALDDAGESRQPVTLGSLGAVYRELGDYPEAERCYRRAIALLEAAQPSRPLDLASTLQNFGALRLVQGRPSQSEPLYRRAYDLRLQALGAGDPLVGIALHGLAQVAFSLHRYRDAEDLYRRAAANLESAYGRSSTVVADVWHNWAALDRETGQDQQARPLLEDAAALYQRVSPLHPKLAIVLRNLAELEAAAGHTDRAEALFQQSLHICETALPAGHPQTGIILQAYGRFLTAAHRKHEAKSVNQRARAILAHQGPTFTVDASSFAAK